MKPIVVEEEKAKREEIEKPIVLKEYHPRIPYPSQLKQGETDD